MAKKEQKKVLVLREMNESAVKNLGANRWANKRQWWILGVVGVSLIWMFIVNMLYASGFQCYLLQIVPFVIVMITVAYKYTKEGNKFWDVVKDMPQPVDLRKL